MHGFRFDLSRLTEIWSMPGPVLVEGATFATCYKVKVWMRPNSDH